jgi:hypothetical protein
MERTVSLHGRCGVIVAEPAGAVSERCPRARLCGVQRGQGSRYFRRSAEIEPKPRIRGIMTSRRVITLIVGPRLPVVVLAPFVLTPFVLTPSLFARGGIAPPGVLRLRRGRGRGDAESHQANRTQNHCNSTHLFLHSIDGFPSHNKRYAPVSYSIPDAERPGPRGSGSPYRSGGRCCVL